MEMKKKMKSIKLKEEMELKREMKLKEEMEMKDYKDKSHSTIGLVDVWLSGELTHAASSRKKIHRFK